jgi:hypothetical protein
MSATEIERAKELRRAVLLVLRACFGDGYEGWLSERTLFSVVYQRLPGLSMHDVAQAGAYLVGKGYAERRERRESKYAPPETDLRIAPRGVDLLEESLAADPGIEDNRA